MRRRLNSKVVSRLKLFPRRASQAGEFVKSGLRPQTASELAEKIRLICNRFFPYELLAQPTRLHWPPALAPNKCARFLKRSGVLPVVGLRLKAPLYAYQPL